VENYSIGVEGGARVAALRLAPGEKLLYVLGSDIPGIRFWRDMFGKEFENALVFLGGQRLAKGTDVLEEFGNGDSERQGIASCLFFRVKNSKTTGVCVQFQSLSLLRFESFGGSNTRGSA
jgi:hypothetical protein